jgi:hypothetical protein
MPNNNQIDKIEAYHAGRMSDEEAALFEKELTSDPSLKAESDFQSNIINGVKEYRKSQLKTRLDAIDVSPGWIEFVQQSSLIKSFGGVAVATVIGTGVYFIAEDKNEAALEETTPAIVKEVTKENIGPIFEEFKFDWDIPESSEVLVNVKAEQLDKSIEIATKAPVSKEDEPQLVTETETQVAVAKETAETPFTPDINAPDAGDVSYNSELNSTVLDDVPVVSELNTESEPIEVETKNTKNARIRYKYYDGKLFLNGNFNKSPYEILEINSANGRRIYLLHMNKYYEVKITDRLTELPEVKDVKLIQELRLIKENK